MEKRGSEPEHEEEVKRQLDDLSNELGSDPRTHFRPENHGLSRLLAAYDAVDQRGEESGEPGKR